MNVGVIFGGRSVEHDVSIVTAHQVMAVLSERHEVVPIYVTREGAWLSAPELNDLEVYRSRRWSKVGKRAYIAPETGSGGLAVAGGSWRKETRIPLDVVIPAIHGTYGEDGTLQGLLELADIPYAGSAVTASAVGMDKIAMKAAFAAAGLPIVDHVVVDADELDPAPAEVLDRIEDVLGYPLFVKPSRLGSSVGIGKAVDRAGLEAALDVALRYDYRILVERSMEGCLEVNCSVLGGPGMEARASVCEQPVAAEEFLTFSDKYLRGAKQGKAGGGMAAQDRRIPAPIAPELTERVQANAVSAFKAIDAAGVVRVDSFVDEKSGDTWVMEINTVPGSFSFYLWEASGMSFGELMDRVIEIAIQTHRRRAGLLFTFESGVLEKGAGVKAGG